MYKIQEIIENYDEDNNYYAELLDKNKPNDHIDLSYEEIFSEDNNDNVKLIETITNFLEISMPPKDIIGHYMVPSSASINSHKRYSDIPNWNEIKKEFEEYIKR